MNNMKLLYWAYVQENVDLTRNSIGVSLKFMLNFTDDKNEVVLAVRDKLQSGKKWCAVMHNNFVNKTFNYTKRAKRPAE